MLIENVQIKISEVFLRIRIGKYYAIQLEPAVSMVLFSIQQENFVIIGRWWFRSPSSITFGL